MRITVRRDRDDKGWVAAADSNRLIGTGKSYDNLPDTLVIMYDFYPEAEVWVDARRHHKLDNGMVFPAGEPDLRPVRYVNG